ncbi:hypothetical protein HN747_02470 [archaeon]|jgi:hypothetical protein|nr:hypothetical protein [archaeon]
MRTGIPPRFTEMMPISEWEKVPFERIARKALPKYEFAIKVLDAREREYVRIANGDVSGLPQEYATGEISAAKRAGDAITNINSARRRIGFYAGRMEERLETDPEELVTEGLGCSFYEQTGISFRPIEMGNGYYGTFQFPTGNLTGHLGGCSGFCEDDTLLQLSPEVRKEAMKKLMQSNLDSLRPIFNESYKQMAKDHGPMPACKD